MLAFFGVFVGLLANLPFLTLAYYFAAPFGNIQAALSCEVQRRKADLFDL